MSTSLKRQIILIPTVFLLLLVLSIAATLWVVSLQKTDARVLNISGRQRMLSQKMSKELFAAQIAPLGKRQESLDALAATANLFDTSLKGMIEGNAEMGLEATSSEAIQTQLATIRDLWLAFRNALDLVSQLETSDPRWLEALGDVYAKNTVLLKESNKAVSMYEEGAGGKVLLLKELQLILLLLAAGTLFLAMRFLHKRITQPILDLENSMLVLAGGDASNEIPGVSRVDELGAMARAVEVFRDKMLENERLVASQKEHEAQEARQKRQMLLELAARFEQQVGTVASSILTAASSLNSEAGDVMQLSEHTSGQTAGILESVATMSAGMESVSATSEELTSTIQEIGRQMSQSAQTADRAVGLANEATARVQPLTESAQRIGEVIAIIAAIADKTNLLALNAKIEAARAGKAGMGFGVVADEVKSLASQSRNALDEISKHIHEIQDESNQTAEAISKIAEAIGENQSYITTIASAVEEQQAATSEIAGSISSASNEITQIRSKVELVNLDAGKTLSTSRSSADSASGMVEEASVLEREVTELLKGLRA